MALQYWDKLKQTLSEAIGTAIAVPSSVMNNFAAGYIGGRAQSTGFDGEAIQDTLNDISITRKAIIDQKAKEFGTSYTNAIAKPLEVLPAAVIADKLMQTVDEVYQKTRPVVSFAISRPITTANLAYADLVSGQGVDLIKEWNSSQNISPGQSLANAYSVGLEALGATKWLQDRNVDLPTFLDPNFNIYDPDQRKQAFEKEFAGKFFSGVPDGLLTWYTDPLVLTGKAISVLRKRNIAGEIYNAEDIFRLRSDLDTHGLFIKTKGAMGRETPIGVVAERLVSKSPAQAIDDSFVKKSTNQGLLADIVGNANTYDDVADGIAAAMGDRTSMNKLAQTQRSLYDQIKKNQEILGSIQEDLLKVDWGSGNVAEKHFASAAKQFETQEVLNDLIRRNKSIDRALTEGVGDYRLVNDYTAALDKEIFGKNIGVAIEKAKGHTSELRHQLSFFTKSYDTGFFGRKVNVIALPFTKLPSGIVRVDGGPLADSATELKAFINSVDEWRTAEKGIDYNFIVQNKTALLDNYISASNPIARKKAIQLIERDAVETVAAKYNIDPEDAMEMWKLHDNIRQKFVDDFESHGSWVDPETEDIITSPFWRTEMPNVVPMIDIKAFDKFLRASKGYFPEYLNEFGVTTRQRINWVSQEGKELADLANSFFKVSVLTRLGYPIRNTVDGQARIMTVLSSIAKSDEILRTGISNTKTRAKIAGNWITQTLSVTRPDQLNTQVGKLIVNRNIFINAREQLLDEISREQYYAGATGTFGIKIPKGDIELAISSPSKSLVTERDRKVYSELQQKMEKQDGLLYGVDRQKYLSVMNKAYQRYLKQEIIPNLPEGTSVVYADIYTGGIYYKVPGKRIPKEGIGDFQTRKGIPAGALEEAPIGPTKVNIRGKAPEPDIRVITSYEAARAENYKQIADLLGEENVNRINFWVDKINEIDDQVVSIIEQRDKLNAIRAELKIARSGEKPVGIKTKNDDVLFFDGAFQGSVGPYKRQEASGAKSLNFLSTTQDYLSFDAMKGAARARKGYYSGKPEVIAPTDPSYWREVARISGFIKNDPMGNMILRGESDHAIATWLRGEGSYYIKQKDIDVTKSEIEKHIIEGRSRVHQLLPDPVIRNLVAREDLTPEQFEILMRTEPNLIPVAGQEFIENGFRYGQGSKRRALQNMASKVINIIGSLPEDKLVSHPFYQRLYERSLERELRIAEGAGKDVRNKQWMINAQRTAHDQARKTLNETLYRIFNDTGASSFARFAIPFFNAQYNALWFWGKKFITDPSVLARAAMLWNAPNRVATVVDEEGNEVEPGVGPSKQQFILFSIDEQQAKRWNIPEGYDLYIPKNSLNIFIQGQNPIFPALGLPILMPVSWFANKRPDLFGKFENIIKEIAGKEAADQVTQNVLPFGRAPLEPLTMALPAWLQRVKQRVGADSDAVYAGVVANAMKINEIDWQTNGRKGPRPGLAEGQALANQLYKIRIAANLTLPFAVTFKPEWQNIVNDYNRALQDPLVGPRKIFDYLYEKYGIEGLYVTAPAGRSVTGVIPSTGAVTNARKYESFIRSFDKAKVPLLAGFVANYGVSEVQGANYSTNYFSNKELRPGGNYVWRDKRASDDIITDREAGVGWYFYTLNRKQLDVFMKENKIPGINSAKFKRKNANGISYEDQWNQKIEQLYELFPAFADDRKRGETDFNKTHRYIYELEKLVSVDSKWIADNKDTAGAKALIGYLVNREYVVQELQARKSRGGSANIDNDKNSNLRESWENYVSDLKLSSDDFANLYNRILEYDDMKEINR